MAVSAMMIEKFFEPLTSPFYLILLLALIIILNRLNRNFFINTCILAVYSMVFIALYILLGAQPAVYRWLHRMNSPLVAVLAVMVLPAVFLPRNRFYKLFLILPASVIVSAVLEVVRQYGAVPQDAGFKWFLMSPAHCIGVFTGILIIAQYFLPLDSFRKFTRISVFILLVYGGFAFRQNYSDYQAMIARRQSAVPDIMNISETSPVMRDDNRLSYIPGAPCRFSADGGYVQGCVMELAQRLFQVNDRKIARGDAVETSYLAIALAALVLFTVLAFIGARWWCGWICPLATLGDCFDRIRRWLKLPHLKPSQPVKITAVVSGLSLGSIGLLLAKAYAYIDENGYFAGCKIPAYPFCKICPGQMVCPVASQGLGALSPLPGTEWLFGFFKITVVALTLFFIAAFLTARRLWCRLCPMGMAGGIFNKGAFLALKKNALKCNGCGICNEVCPMDIHIVQEDMERADVSCFDCIYCLKCVDNCPQNACLSLEFAGKTVVESNLERKLTNARSV